MESPKIEKSVIYLGLIMAFYMLAWSIIFVFLPNFYLSEGLTISQIIFLWVITFVVANGLPIIILKLFPEYFERMLPAGLIFTIIFFIALLFVKSPVILGILNGLGLMAFWPAFNLMIFRYSNVKERGFAVNLATLALPNLFSIIAPAIGGAAIQYSGFAVAFLIGIAFLVVALLLSSRLKYAPATFDFALPKKLWMPLVLLAITTILYGFGETQRIAYPLFVKSFSSSFFNMGLLATALTAILVVTSLIVGKLAEIETNRIGFSALNIVLWFIALIVLANATSIYHLAIAATIMGVAGAFSMMLFALFGDFFGREHHATILATREIFLMAGRMLNLVVVGIFFAVGSYNFSGYFWVTGLISLLAVIPLGVMYWMYGKGQLVTDAKQD